METGQGVRFSDETAAKLLLAKQGENCLWLNVWSRLLQVRSSSNTKE